MSAKLFLGAIICFVTNYSIAQTPSQIGSTTVVSTDDDFPKRPIKVVVPFGAGGGSDTFARIIQKSIEENNLLPQPIVIINVPGAGGTIGSRQVLEAEPDGYTILCLHEGIISAKYAGTADYGPEAFEPVAGTGEVGSVIAVADDSQYNDLGELLSDASDRPEQIVFSANIGAPSHFIGLMLEKAKPGAKFRYTQTGGAAKRFAALAGRHIDVSAFSLAEYKQFQPAGLKALCFCGQSRHPSAPEVPTATEQGFDVEASMMQFWWAPKETPPDRIKIVADVLNKAMQTQQVKESLESIYTDNVVATGSQLQQSLAERERRFADVALRDLTEIPNIPYMVLGVVAVLSLVVAFQSLLMRSEPPDDQVTEETRANYSVQPWLAVAAIVATGIYVLAMQLNWLSFRVATFVFILSVGILLTRLRFNRLPVLIVIAITVSLGLHTVFTQVFSIALP